MSTYIGKEIERIDGPERVCGNVVYGPDVYLPGMLHGAVARSQRAHALIKKIDIAAALKAEGVHTVITGDMMPYNYGNMIGDQPFLVREKTRYYGEPLALVVATTELQAQMAAELVQVEYVDLPCYFDPLEAASPDAALIHDDQHIYVRDAARYPALDKTNICHHSVYTLGDAEAAFAKADKVFEHSFFSHPTSHTAMEPFATVAIYDAVRQEYTLWTTTDAPHRRLGELAKIFGVGQEKIRITTTAQGGGFGGKGCLFSEVLALSGAKYIPGRPVRFNFSREEVLAMSGTRMGARLTIKSGVMRDGSIVARTSQIHWDNGAYASKSPEVSYRGATTSVGPYNIPHITIESTLVYTNNQTGTSFRGFGTTQSAYACEMHMDMIAEAMGFDPVDFRMRNAYAEGDPYINGQAMISVGLKETLEKAAESIGWAKAKPTPARGKAIGRGVACMLKGTNTPSLSTCLVRMANDASVRLMLSTMEIGAGQHTAMAQIAAETLGVALERIRVPQPDTSYTPFDFGTTSSRSTFHMGNAVRLAAEDLRTRIFTLLAERHNLAVEGFSAEADHIRHSSGADWTYPQAMGTIYPRGADIFGQSLYTPAGLPMLASRPGYEGWSSAFWMFSSHAAEVEVDTNTGHVDVRCIAAAHDVGKAINALNCIQQIEGSVIMGASMALCEEFKVAPDGRLLNDTLLDYKVATSLDIPHKILPIIVESEHPYAPYGAKGVGEPAAGCTPPAIANALHDAVGVWITELPITPEKVLAALRAKGDGN